MIWPSVTWQTLDWDTLDRLRNVFLGSTTAEAGAPYWTSLRDLANYDFTYAQRIGWKWDAVLRELRLRGWRPPQDGPLIDWGCGSGIASRRGLGFFGAESFSALHLVDRSPLAMDFAAETARRRFPSLNVHSSDGVSENLAGRTVVISHVLNELTQEGGRALRSFIDR